MVLLYSIPASYSGLDTNITGAETCQPQQQIMKRNQTPRCTKLPEKHQRSAATYNALKIMVVLAGLERSGCLMRHPSYFKTQYQAKP